jgi:rhodanese-related sulfurtransferase
VAVSATTHANVLITIIAGKKGGELMRLKIWSGVTTVIILLALLVAVPLLSACGGSAPAATSAPATSAPAVTTQAPQAQKAEFEVIRTAANAYLTSSPQWNIAAKDLYMLINDDDKSNDPVIVSVRAAADYAKGHVPGAINIPLADLAKPESLAKLPKDGKIVAYCYTGHTGSQATAILNLLGYNTSNLKFGMTSWTKNTDVASGRYDEAKDCMDYPFETTANIPTKTYSLPTIENTSSNDDSEILRAAANAYVTSSPQWNIAAKDLYLLLNDGDPSNDPVIVSVRSAADYAKGHVPGAINIPLADLAKPENLAKLPTDKKIVAYCYTGHTGSQATAILNLLGYDASNLKFGMTSWTKNTDVASGRYDEAKDCMDYPFVTGTSPK